MAVLSTLPTFRQKILHGFLLVVALYAVLGAILVGGLFMASKTTPKLLHDNYISISAVVEMTEAWNALKDPAFYPTKSPDSWRDQFEKALRVEENNYPLEPGEQELYEQVRALWEQWKSVKKPLVHEGFEKVNGLLKSLITVNEQGMFILAEKSERTTRDVLIGTVFYFMMSLALSVLLANRLARRLSLPLRSIAETLHCKPSIGKPLDLIGPNSLEVQILNQELSALWERVRESERVNIAEVLQQKSKLKTILASVEDGLLVLDGSGRVLHCNHTLLELVQLPADKVLDRLWQELHSKSKGYLKLCELIAQGITEDQEVELETGSAGKRHYSMRVRKIGGSEVEVGSLYLFRDMTERKQREKFKTEFVDLLSHELKTPLQSLVVASEIFVRQKHKIPEDMKFLVETISEDVDRIRAVANEFVQITQSHSRVMKLKFDSVTLSQLLPEWIKPFTVVARDRQVRVSFRQEGLHKIQTRIDQVKFPWVISNLVSNAIRFSPAGGEIQVVLAENDGFIQIHVKDEGPGIAEEDQLKMFDPFFQSQVKNFTGGSGLFGIGLTIAKDVVEAHDGRIEYHPGVPRGSDFKIILPYLS